MAVCPTGQEALSERRPAVGRLRLLNHREQVRSYSGLRGHFRRGEKNPAGAGFFAYFRWGVRMSRC